MFLVVVLAVSLLVYYVLTISFYRDVAKYPKGPTPLPFLGNFHQLTPGRVFQAAEYGSVFTMFIPSPMVVITDYDAVKEAFIHHGDDFAARPRNVVFDAISYIPNGGVINSTGESWREQRRTAISILRDFGMGKNLMEEKVKDSIREFLRYLADIKDKEHIDMRWPIQLMIANIINETIFGFKYAYDDCQRLIDYVEGFNKLMTDLSQTKLLLVALKFPWVQHIPYIGYHALHKHRINRYIEEECDRSSKTFNEDEESTCFVHSYLQRMPSNPLLTLNHGRLPHLIDLVEYIQDKELASYLQLKGARKDPSAHDRWISKHSREQRAAASARMNAMKDRMNPGIPIRKYEILAYLDEMGRKHTTGKDH